MISLETPQGKWASSRLEGRTSWIFSSCGRCSRLTTGTLGTRTGGLRKGHSPCQFLGGLSGFLSGRSRGLRSCVEPVPKPEDSSPVLTWIWGYFWSLPRTISSYSRVEAGALVLRRGHQGPALVASGKASPDASCLGASRDSSPVDAGA